uniref:Si:ch211-202f5.3 n=1 Tax=Cyprinus carpio TaxID=7962 RepID=A0A8C2AQF1_CYPCA
MNISIENPYGDVTIPRAKLRDQPDSSTIIMNPMALESTYNNRKSAFNPYNSFKTPGENNTSSVPVYGEARNGSQNPPPAYTVRESDEQVGRCYACCCRCRCRRKK